MILRRVAGSEVPVGFGNANDFDLGIVQRMFQKSLDVPVNQANDANPKRRLVLEGRALTQEIGVL